MNKGREPKEEFRSLDGLVDELFRDFHVEPDPKVLNPEGPTQEVKSGTDKD